MLVLDDLLPILLGDSLLARGALFLQRTPQLSGLFETFHFFTVPLIVFEVAGLAFRLAFIHFEEGSRSVFPALRQESDRSF
jgi:hypothetical protein